MCSQFVLLKHDLPQYAKVIHAGACGRRRPDRAVDGFSRERVVAAEVRFPGDPFGGGFDAERRERDGEMRGPAFVRRIDTGFAGSFAVQDLKVRSYSSFAKPNCE